MSQHMIFDVQPLVKSSFCPIRPSPNGFFDSEGLYPLKPDIIVLGAGVGGSKVCAQKFVLKSLCSERGTNWAAMTGRPAPAAVGGLGFEPSTCTAVVVYITVRPCLGLTVSVLPTA